MFKKDCISIIIPCYNAAKTIGRTLISLREQDYKNLEIIVINDGSVDNSLEVVDKFVSIDERIKVYTQPNSGVSVARNNGLKRANGSYIIFLDADDNYTTPYALSSMMNLLKETDSDLCVCNFTHPCFEQHIDAGVYNLTNKKEFIKFYQDFFAFGMPWNKLAKRECYTEDFIEGIKFTEDEIYNLYNLKNIGKLVVTNEVYHNYYCAPYNPNEVASAVNSIYASDNFLENKNTVWHKGMETQKYRLFAIEKFYPELKDDMQYVRSFDFFFWDFFIMAKNRVAEENICKICKGIFQEDLFIKTLKHKEKYGLILKKFSEKDIEMFVKLAYYSFRDIKSYNKKLSMYKVFLCLFGKFFYELTEHIDTSDILAECCLRRLDKSSAESIYINTVLEMQDI